MLLTLHTEALTKLPSTQFVFDKSMDKYCPDPLPIELIIVVPNKLAGDIMSLTAYHDCIIDDLNKALPVTITKNWDLLRTSSYQFEYITYLVIPSYNIQTEKLQGHSIEVWAERSSKSNHAVSINYWTDRC